MWQARCRLCEWLVLGLAAAAPAASQDFVYLHVLPVTATAEVAGKPEAPLQVTWTPGSAATFEADWLTALGTSVSDGQAVFTLEDYPQLGGAVTDAHRAASFVIDFDEPEVLELTARLVAEHGDSPSVAELIRFTDQFITVKTMSRGWDLPSQIARHHEGDCTEHAVLLTALARATGRPARVAVGVVLVWIGGAVEAYGHAWSEIHDGTLWQPADGTRLDRAGPVRYIPMTAVADEGPGYEFRLFGKLVSTWPKKIDLRLATAAGGRR
jgi:transglutaminase-like putative cysteine protease